MGIVIARTAALLFCGVPTLLAIIGFPILIHALRTAPDFDEYMGSLDFEDGDF